MTSPSDDETRLFNMNKFVHVYTAYGQLSGEMIRLLLNSVNIPAVLSQESAGVVYGLTIGSLGEVKVLVPAERADEAKKILQDMEEGKLITDVNLERLESKSAVYKKNKLSKAENIKDQTL